jgi:AAA15 family ATPase/GTPase
VFLNAASVGGSKETADRYSELSRSNREGPIAKAVNDIFPYVTELSVLSPTGVPAIHATVRGVNRKIPLGQVSSGINKFVAILQSIITASGSAVLVDEIENGLYYKTHFEMWKKIVALAEVEKTQLFVTTHSNEFLQRIAPIVSADDKNYRLIRLEKSNGSSQAKEFSGKEFSGAISSGVDVR